MNNRNSLYLCHALTGEAKRQYNKAYYREHEDYWPEWRKKNSLGAITGETRTESGVAGIKASEGAKNALNVIKGVKTPYQQTMSDMNELKQTIANMLASRNGTFYNTYYKNETVRSRNLKTQARMPGPTIRTPGYHSAVKQKVAEAEEKRRLEQEKRIRIRNRIASVYKLEWNEAQERAKKLPNRIVNGLKNAISSIKTSVSEAIRLGKK